MKFSELKVGDCFYIEENGNKLPFKKTKFYKIKPNMNNDVIQWNSSSLITGSCHLIYFLDDFEVFPFDEDGFY